jgi:1-acyl-sn-glycerol-3-phosphate acyltransferase
MPSLLRGPLGRSLRSAERRILDWLFQFLFVYDCRGQEHVPAKGPAVVASNHPSYLDGILLSIRVRRPIRFMAWEALFKVPVLGWLLQSFGAFPVSSTRGKGREAYERAKALVQAGKVVGIFPEGRRSQSGIMEPTVREGAARLAWETGAPLVPATITGAYRAWPYFRELPRPARIRVRFHPPIDPTAYRGMSEHDAIASILVEWRRRVERSLRPGSKADERISRLWLMPAPRARLHEWALAIVSALVLAWGHAATRAYLGPAAYLIYVFADFAFVPQRRLFKWLRNTSPLTFILAFGPVLFHVMGVPAVPAGLSLDAVLVGALLPYFYERSSVSLGFVRGLVLASTLELVALRFAERGFGPHVALPLFAAAYATLQRTVSWRFAAPALSVYALAVGWFMGGRSELLVHAAAGLVAAVLAWLWPYHPSPRAERPLPTQQRLTGPDVGDSDAA